MQEENQNKPEETQVTEPAFPEVENHVIPGEKKGMNLNLILNIILLIGLGPPMAAITWPLRLKIGAATAHTPCSNSS